VVIKEDMMDTLDHVLDEILYLVGKKEPHYPVPALRNSEMDIILDWYDNSDDYWHRPTQADGWKY
jgi:hypothetical protein